MPAPRMFILAGPPGAGKSSVFSLQNFASQVFNADDRAADLNAGSYRDIPLHVRRAVNQDFERFVHGDIAKRQSFALETTLRSKITFEQAQLANSQGFEVIMTYVALVSFEKHLERVRQRAFLGGHAASEATLRRIYESSMANLPITLNRSESGIQFLRVFDNSAFQTQPNLALEAFNGRVVRIVRIPAKPNADSEGKPNGIPGQTRTPSERSDAGISIVQEVFGFVKENYPERSEVRAPQARKGAWGKDGTSCPRSAYRDPERDSAPKRHTEGRPSVLIGYSEAAISPGSDED